MFAWRTRRRVLLVIGEAILLISLGFLLSQETLVHLIGLGMGLTVIKKILNLNYIREGRIFLMHDNLASLRLRAAISIAIFSLGLIYLQGWWQLAAVFVAIVPIVLTKISLRLVR